MMFGILSSRNRYVYMAGVFFYKITEPFYSRIRKIIPPIANIDFSPMILILGLVFVQEALARLIMKFM
jgi:YggT family protein